MYIGVNHRDFQAVHKSDSVNSDFAIVESVVDALNGHTIKNSFGILKSDFVPLDVGFVFSGFQVNFIMHIYIM